MHLEAYIHLLIIPIYSYVIRKLLFVFILIDLHTGLSNKITQNYLDKTNDKTTISFLQLIS